MSGILVVAEVRRGEVRDVSLELITAAVALSAQGAGPVRVAVVAPEPERHAQTLDAAGVEEVLLVRSPLEHFEPHVQGTAVRELIEALDPSLVLAGHTVDSMGWAAAVAAQLGTGFASDVTRLGLIEGTLQAERGIYGDRLLAALGFPDHPRVIALLRPGAFPPAAGGGGGRVRESGVALDASHARTEHLGFREPEAGDVDITKAGFLLAIGRGVEEQSDVEKMERLAEAIGATVVSSRPLVDAGWLPASRQVGQSGRTVAPKVYLAMGISGAIQHIMGMRGSETIIAVNHDPNAPIFGIAAYGAVADLHDVADELAAQFRS